MGAKLAYVYSEDFLRYDFGPDHPLKPIRLKLTYELSRKKGLFDDHSVEVVLPHVATEDELRLFHTGEYVNMVKTVSRSGHGLLDLGDTPAFKGVYEASAMAAGASLDAVDAVMSGRADHGINISGGLHHAHNDRASGFCVFNDPALAIAYLKNRYRLRRVMYLDIDAHHGDGVMFGFYADPGVLDVDFHEDGRYLFPGSGFTSETGQAVGEGLKVNIPVLPQTGDQPYLSTFREIVPELVRGYEPEFILVQCGADSHTDDLLAHLELTTRSYEEIIKTMHQLAHEVASGRIVAFGGGGYNLTNVARCWTVVAGALGESQLSDEIPTEWKKILREATGLTAPETLRSIPPKRYSPENGASHLRKTVVDLREKIPLLKRSASTT